MPRYLPVGRDAANSEILSVYAEVERDTGSVPNFIRTLAHSPHYLKPVADLYRAVSTQSGFSEKLRALIVLKTCKLDKCKATVQHYSAQAQEAGWTDEQIEGMDNFADSDLFNYYEKDLLTLAELIWRSPDEISQEQFWTQLDNHFTSDQVVEAITLIGFINLINRFCLAIQVEPDPAPVATPE